MANVTQERDATEVGNVPIDVQTVSKITNEVLALQLNTSTREAITTQAGAIHGSLNLLVREELGADEDPIVRDLIRKAYVLLATDVPTMETPCFSAFNHMREAAGITRRLLRVWTELNGVESP